MIPKQWAVAPREAVETSQEELHNPHEKSATLSNV